MKQYLPVLLLALCLVAFVAPSYGPGTPPPQSTLGPPPPPPTQPVITDEPTKEPTPQPTEPVVTQEPTPLPLITQQPPAVTIVVPPAEHRTISLPRSGYGPSEPQAVNRTNLYITLMIVVAVVAALLIHRIFSF